MKIKADQDLLERLVKWAFPFADKTQFVSSTEHLSCILLEADEAAGSLRLTAENEVSAISFAVTEGVEVASGGEVLVKAAWLKSVLSVVPSGEVVSLSTTDAGKRLRVEAGRSKMSVALSPLTERSRVPETGDFASAGVVMDAKDFVSGFSTGGVSFDARRRRPALHGVHFSVVDGSARFLSTDQQCVTYRTKEAKVLDEGGSLALLLEPVGTKASLEYVSLGERVEVHPGDGDVHGKPAAHLLVLDEQGQEMFHVRVPTEDQPVSDYPADALLEMLVDRLKGARSIFRLARPDLVRLLNNAAELGGHSPEQSGGQGKFVTLTLDRREVGAGVPGNTSYDASTDLTSYSGAAASFVVKWGIHGHVLTSYPAGEDEEVNGVLVEAEDEPVAVALFTSSGGWQPSQGAELPQDYFGMFPVANGAYDRD